LRSAKSKYGGDEMQYNEQSYYKTYIANLSFFGTMGGPVSKI